MTRKDQVNNEMRLFYFDFIDMLLKKMDFDYECSILTGQMSCSQNERMIFLCEGI